jgi:uncharacterized protein (UPF0332 family)
MTARLIRSHELLEVAKLLARAKAGPGRPRTAQLRRAVSTAYYALFHELVAQAVTELCGTDPGSEAERRNASRWVAHTDLLTLTQAATQAARAGAARAVASVLGSPHPDLRAIASIFGHLQEARQHADYDHDFDVTRERALELIHGAANAIDRARRLQQSGDPSHRRFLKLMVGAVKVARTRA